MIKIREVFHTAGLKYKWPYNKAGVGIRKSEFEGEGDMEIMVEDTLYRIDKQKARDFVNQYKSYYVAQSVPLGVLALEILTKVEDERQDKLI
jgi:hypothetical protein